MLIPTINVLKRLRRVLNMADRLGQRFGNYQLVRLLGKGGFAEVYLGEHIYLKSQAAIKVLLTQLGDEEAKSFLAEARLLAGLRHQHIVRVLEFGIEGDTPFLVMDYAPHGTLRQLHPKGTILPSATVVTYVRQVASALQYAHDQKLIHRDVKPENLLLQEDDDVLLSDFGIALIAQTSRLQSRYEIIGTATYMAPEQIQGKPVLASDQYSLGIIVYEWLGGNPPFQGSFTEVCAQHMFACPEPLHEKVPTIPPDVEHVVMTALAKEPRQRFANMRAFATALEQACQMSHSYAITPAYPTPDQLAFAPSIDGQRSTAEQPVPVPVGPQPHTHYVSEKRIEPDLAVQEDQVLPLPGNFQPAPAPGGRIGAVMQSARRYMLQSMRRGQGFSINFAVLLTILVVLVIGGGGLLLYFTTVAPKIHAITAEWANPTSTHGAVAVQSTATATQSPNATSTAAASQATATAQAKSTPTQAVATPTPTPQPAPTPTPIPTPTQQASGGPTLNDPLTGQDANQWDVLTFAGGGGCSFTNGAYQASMPQIGHFASCMARATNFSNFAYQVQMTILSGTSTDGGGLIFRSNANEQYRFRVGADGSYDLVDPAQTLASGSSTAIKTGLNQTNVLKVVARGGNISLYVNGQFIVRVNDSSSSSGQIGVMAVGFTDPTNVAFSNAEVWQL
jgi:serine/threonine protein kinase